MDAMDAIMTRRSIRRFSEEPVTAEETDVLLRAAMVLKNPKKRADMRT
jgi:nitroreductase